MRFVPGLVATLLLGTTLASQNHEQGVQRCRAQYNIWFHAVDASKVSVAELNKRLLFLTGCELIDQSDPPKYEQLMRVYDQTELIRYRAFVQRHGLDAQFEKEDAVLRRN
jgi:hypothetical protein